MDLHDLLKREDSDVFIVKVLDVKDWRDCRWTTAQTAGLTQLCARREVECLRFRSGVSPLGRSIMEPLAEASRGKGFAFLPRLKEIYIQFNGNDPSFYSLVAHSRVKSIQWEIVGATTLCQSVLIIANHLNSLSTHNRLRKCYSLLEVKIFWQEAGYRSDTFTFFAQSKERKYMDYILERNRVGWQWCQDVVVICLALRNRRLKTRLASLGRDVWHLIVGVVWNTRGTKVWTYDDT
jgi:hypothetical protein